MKRMAWARGTTEGRKEGAYRQEQYDPVTAKGVCQISPWEGTKSIRIGYVL